MTAYIFYLLIYPLLLLVSIYLGRKIAFRSQKKKHQWKPLGLEGGLMGFYALLTSFTLVQSGNNAHEREVMIHTAAEDISEILRISVTDEPELKGHIRAYFSDFNHIIAQPAETDPTGIKLRIQTIDHLDEAFDKTMLKYLRDHPSSRERVASLLGNIDKMESVFYRFIHSYQRTIPKMILLILVLFSLFIGFLLGFIGKFYGNHIHITTTTFVVMSIIILNTIHDLDNPSAGFIRPDFQDITEVMNTYHIGG